MNTDPHAISRIERIVVAFEAGRDGFWLARWLRARAIKAYRTNSTHITDSRTRAPAPAWPRSPVIDVASFNDWPVTGR